MIARSPPPRRHDAFESTASDPSGDTRRRACHSPRISPTTTCRKTVAVWDARRLKPAWARIVAWYSGGDKLGVSGVGTSLKIYLDTSVLGAVCDALPKERLAATREFLDRLAAGRFEGYISTVVLEEVERAPDAVRQTIASELQGKPLGVLEESPESLALARLYVSEAAIPAAYEDDARHVAIAVVNGIGVIVSWNFRHTSVIG